MSKYAFYCMIDYPCSWYVCMHVVKFSFGSFLLDSSVQMHINYSSNTSNCRLIVLFVGLVFNLAAKKIIRTYA